MAKAQEGDKMVELTLLPSGPIPPAAFDNAFGYGMMQTPEEVNEVLREVYLRGQEEQRTTQQSKELLERKLAEEKEKLQNAKKELSKQQQSMRKKARTSKYCKLNFSLIHTLF